MSENSIKRGVSDEKTVCFFKRDLGDERLSKKLKARWYGSNEEFFVKPEN
jgi:hypothetical protein